MKSVLVTGAFGYLGRNCIEYYKAKGCYTAAIGRCQEQPRNTLADTYVVGSLSLDNLRQFEQQFDLVIHCAGSGSVSKVMADPAADFADTVQGTEYLLEYLRVEQPDARIIVASSAAVYGDKYTSPISENDTINAVSLYGIHKDLVEHLCAHYARLYALKISIIRFFSIYGPGLQKQLLWDACNKLTASDKRRVTFWGTGNEVRDFIEISDALRLIEALESGDGSFSVVNGGSGESTHVSDVLSELSILLGAKSTVHFNNKTRAGDPDYLCADTTLAAHYGWRPNITLSEGLRKYVSWYKAFSR